MSFPEDIDTRAMYMWQAISQHVDFRKRYVAVFGCGHGEMLWRTVIAGAEYVCGFDKSFEKQAEQIACIYNKAKIVETDLNVAVAHGNPYWLIEKRWDIALCLSSLDLLETPRKAIRWIADNFPIAVIEARYEPEPHNIGISSDAQMFSLLRASGFRVVYQIGQTHVKSQDAYRTIWKCHNER
jgi:predicted RNA methylase